TSCLSLATAEPPRSCHASEPRGNGVDENPGAQAMMTRNREMSSVGKRSSWARSSDPNRNTNTPESTHLFDAKLGNRTTSTPVFPPYTDVLPSWCLVTSYLSRHSCN
ncbi:hypothetical protein GQ607_003798, partial [Colletotrichum asianum]